MIFEHTGIIVIEEGLELENSKMEIMEIRYDLITNQFDIEIHFWETKHRHSRTFNTINSEPGSLSMDYVTNYVMSHEVLGLYNPII